MKKSLSKNKYSMKKILAIIIVIVSVGAVGFAAISYFKPDWMYLIHDKMNRRGQNAAMKVLDKDSVAMKEYTLEQLLSKEDCQIEQSLMLINQENLIQEDFQPDTNFYKDTDVVMNVCIMKAYEELAADVYEKFQEKLYVMSAYRTAQQQLEAIEKEGEKATAVNASEHQAGLALDVYVKNFAGSGFLKTEPGQFVNSSCWNYGFIIRYPYYGVEETGIGFEPWHIRYVGFPHAELIYKNSWTLEEYLETLEVGNYYTYGDYVITKQKGEVFFLPEAFSEVVISPDNMGNYIITVK